MPRVLILRGNKNMLMVHKMSVEGVIIRWTLNLRLPNTLQSFSPIARYRGFVTIWLVTGLGNFKSNSKRELKLLGKYQFH